MPKPGDRGKLKGLGGHGNRKSAPLVVTIDLCISPLARLDRTMKARRRSSRSGLRSNNAVLVIRAIQRSAVVDVTAAMHRLDTECPIGADLVRALPCQCRDACRTDNTPRLQVRDMELEAR
jgi:hypothetical protein